MIKKKGSMFAKRYQSSYESKDKGGATKANVMDWKKVDDVKFFSPSVGRNRINIVPFEIKTKNHPLVKRGEMEVGDMDYVMDIWVHRGVGPTQGSVVCLKNTFGKACPICEQASILRKQGKEEEADALKASRRVFYNVQDMKEPDTLKVFETSHYLFEKELIDEARDDEEGGFVDFADPEEGKEIKFKATEDALGTNKFLRFKSFSFEDREEPISKKLLDSAISFDEIINIPSYEEVKSILFGNDEGEDEEEESDEEDEEEAPSKRVRDEEEDDRPSHSKKSSYEEDENDEEDENPSSMKCPHGHKFGKDCDKHDVCDNCDIWEKCFKSK